MTVEAQIGSPVFNLGLKDRNLGVLGLNVPGPLHRILLGFLREACLLVHTAG